MGGFDIHLRRVAEPTLCHIFSIYQPETQARASQPPTIRGFSMQREVDEEARQGSPNLDEFARRSTN
ncbi:hypothetical protein KIN_38180 [Litoreibacter roseus]|uniref:Uncharacterized protein n=1 Tax=Litoreibacter roseus TaxID=2601869 RepID=A0A6N6JKR2_9RHOB|nr:hypothetical protein KIN_38180 [Litoreibacter roseus]